MKTLVSIMIPTYNQEEYIAEAVQSALSQDYGHIEVVVTDDCSTDNTAKVIRSFHNPKLRYHRNATNLGRVGNYHNTAHNVAIGDWAINLDGDDYFTSNTFVTSAMEVIAKRPNDNIVAYCFKHDNLEEIKLLIPFEVIDYERIIVSGKDYFLNYYKIGRFGHSSILFNRKIGVSLDLYTLPYQACDFHSLIRLFLLGNIVLDRRPISYWRVHGTNTTIKEVDDKQRQAMLTFDAIESFAKQYISTEELSIWRREMNKSSYLDYVRTYCSVHRNLKSVCLLLSNPRMKRWYFRCWFKFLFNR